MVKKLNLNTAIIVKYKNGEILQFDTIEDASDFTGLSVATLKTRANKGNTGKKDGISCEWVDEHTKLSYKSRAARRKGHGYERLLIKELTEFGFKGLVTSRSQNKRLDAAKVDIAETENTLSCYIQAKSTKVVPLIRKINSECPLKDRPLAIFWQAEGKEEYVIIPKQYFYELFLSHDKPVNFIKNE